MPTVDIVIDVAGEAAGSPGVARTFVYSKIDPTPPLVTLSLDDDTDVTSYLWAIAAQPYGATAVLSSTTVASPTFTPTASIPGTYLVECTVNTDEEYGRNGLAFLTELLGGRKPAPTEVSQFGARGWETALAGWFDEVETKSHPRTLTDTGTPDGVVSGAVGQLYFDTTNKILYVNHDGATGWYVV